MNTQQRSRSIRERIGVVLSDKMNKTIVVKVERTTAHPIFKKTIKKFAKFKAHDEKNEARVGDLVRIKETRPLSGDKRWMLVEIIEKAREE